MIEMLKGLLKKFINWFLHGSDKPVYLKEECLRELWYNLGKDEGRNRWI